MNRMPNSGETVFGLDFGTYLGGKGGNQAMALARLGAAPIVVGRVGDDDFGRMYREALAQAGADVRHVSTDGHAATGTALIEVDTDGNNRIVVVAGANAELTPAQALDAVRDLAEGDIVLLQLEVPLETVTAVAELGRRRNSIVILDPAPARELPASLLANLSWLTPNEHEAAVLSGIDTSTEQGLATAAEALEGMGVDHVVIKAGSRGALYRHAGAVANVAGFVVDVVDTTAAGDSFNGGLAWALSREDNPVDAIRAACAAGALSVTGKGAQSAMPTADSVMRLLSD